MIDSYIGIRRWLLQGVEYQLSFQCTVSTLFTVSIGTPYLLTILVLKLSILLPVDVSKILLYVWQTM